MQREEGMDERVRACDVRWRREKTTSSVKSLLLSLFVRPPVRPCE